MYELYAINRKTGSTTKVSEGPIGKLGKEIGSRRLTDKENDFAVYRVGRNAPEMSTYSGGANPHAWDTRASNKSRKRSGLSAYRK